MSSEVLGLNSKIEKRTYPLFLFGTCVNVTITCPKDLSMEDGKTLALLQVKTIVDDEYKNTDGETQAFNNRVHKACKAVFSKEVDV